MMTVNGHSTNGEHPPTPALDIPESLVKSLHMSRDQLLLLRPLFACHVSRFTPGVISNSWLPRALLVTETGQLLLFDTHDGRVTHETSLRFHESSIAEGGMTSTTEDKRLVHVVFENQVEKAAITTMWLKINVTDSCFAAILRFHEPFFGMPATLLRVIMRFVPECHVSVQKCAQEGPLVKFIPKELCSISSVKSNNASPRRSGALSPRSSVKYYMTQVVLQEQQRQNTLQNEATEAQNVLAEASEDRSENEVSYIPPLTAEEFVSPHHPEVSVLANYEDTVPTSGNGDGKEEKRKESDDDDDDYDDDDDVSEGEEQASDVVEDILQPQREVDEEGYNRSVEERSEYTDPATPKNPEEEEETEKNEKRLEMLEKDDILLLDDTDKDKYEREEIKRDKYDFYGATMVMSSASRGHGSVVEKEILQKQALRDSMAQKSHTSLPHNDEKKRVQLVSANTTKDTQLKLSTSGGARCSRNTTPLQRETPTLSESFIPSGKVSEEIISSSTSQDEVEENELPSVYNSNLVLDEPQQISSTSLKKMDNVDTIINDDVLPHSSKKHDETVSSPLYISTTGGAAITENSVAVALRANGVHILSTYPLQRPTTDHTNETRGSPDTKHYWQEVYYENFGRKSEPRSNKRTPTAIYTRTLTS